MKLDVLGNIAYCYTGGKPFDPDLPTIVFIHGAQNDHSVWALQTRYLAHHGFGVLAVDLPGHGRSAGSPVTTIEGMADWLLCMLDAAGVRQAALVGHSMGSLVALEACHRAPQRISHLAMIGTAYPMAVSEALLATSRDDVERAIDMVNIWSHSTFAQKPGYPGPGFYTMGTSRRLMQHIARSESSPVFYIDFAACNAYANGEHAARSVQCPSLLLLGKRDVMTPVRATSVLTSALRQCEVVQLENCGHALMAEQPDAVLDVLFRFVKH